MYRDSKMGVYLDGSRNVVVSRLEVIEGPSGRRRRTKAERARISYHKGLGCFDLHRDHPSSRSRSAALMSSNEGRASHAVNISRI